MVADETRSRSSTPVRVGFGGVRGRGIIDEVRPFADREEFLARQKRLVGVARRIDLEEHEAIGVAVGEALEEHAADHHPG
jgi:hypothetical protein